MGNCHSKKTKSPIVTTESYHDNFQVDPTLFQSSTINRPTATQRPPQQSSNHKRDDEQNERNIKPVKKESYSVWKADKDMKLEEKRVEVTSTESHQNDGFVRFVKSGGLMGDLIESNKPPPGWNEMLRKRYPVCCKPVETKDGSLLYQATIHINDEELATKRHFLAFFQIRPHLLDPHEFIDWCKQNHMYNTILDYIALYATSRLHGPGSMCLRGLPKEPNAVKVMMTDRFVLPTGIFRAVIFYARTEQAVRRMVNIYLKRLPPSAARSVRCGFPEELVINSKLARAVTQDG
ncbi:hypothetical protein CSKR_104172 [Clonorchis sinensis]|uniref:Uncharacterized protein n=1 Tax=Clonorchis sinensis TaxID=79923 RepID=A0A8T1MW32_CLOSI|nr:hypothetical protein CSKR_104172 [Clonorchis sinensis]